MPKDGTKKDKVVSEQKNNNKSSLSSTLSFEEENQDDIENDISSPGIK